MTGWVVAALECGLIVGGLAGFWLAAWAGAIWHIYPEEEASKASAPSGAPKSVSERGASLKGKPG